MKRSLEAVPEELAIRGGFRLSRGAKHVACVVVARIHEGGASGAGECVPYARYGETIDRVLAQLESCRMAIEEGRERAALGALLPPGAARNALDCALLDLEAKLTGQPVHALLGLRAPAPVATAYTISLDSPDAMAIAARARPGQRLFKLKLAGDSDDTTRISAVRAAAPSAAIIVDANEACRPLRLERSLHEWAALGVTLVEQPLPAGDDGLLSSIAHPIPVCADESCHTSADLDALAAKYDAINVKLDKTGGLTEAIRLVAGAKERDLRLMLGCMVSTSLSIAPLLLLAHEAEWIDLDGPLLLERDRPGGVVERDGVIAWPSRPLWGGA